MATDKTRLQRLERLARLRAVERHEATRRMALAVDAQCRSDDLLARCRDITARYAATDTAQCGQDLVGAMRFAAHMADVAETSRQCADLTAEASRLARQDMATAQRRGELVEQRLDSEKRAYLREDGRDNPELARNLMRRSRT
ncbi:hypothetical protein [Aurantiacibacter luteus]|uniref:Flagellar FliJ protein n=1 Tax=Aurantiacibacter luteus TaxID=1581420 RepID=A0A0G9MKQ3_9SPHN|nr:hypothetical protein [Aurantiacibacter luteus]KLE31265.1 hypothetical protein AAW00_13975 [Aurantiacibacter luteus]